MERKAGSESLAVRALSGHSLEPPEYRPKPHESWSPSLRDLAFPQKGEGDKPDIGGQGKWEKIAKESHRAAVSRRRSSTALSAGRVSFTEAGSVTGTRFFGSVDPEAGAVKLQASARTAPADTGS